jgi:hypothetical protein
MLHKPKYPLFLFVKIADLPDSLPIALEIAL